MNFLYFFDFADEMRDFNESIDYLFDILININDFRDYFLDDFYGGRGEHYLWFFFKFIYFGNFLDERH